MTTGNSNMLFPTVVPPETIEEMNEKLKDATAKIMGTSGPSNIVVLVRDMIMGNLTIEEQMLIDAITPHIGASGNWFIGATDTGVSSGGYVQSPDGKVWKVTSISNDGTKPIYSVVYDPNA